MKPSTRAAGVSAILALALIVPQRLWSDTDSFTDRLQENLTAATYVVIGVVTAARPSKQATGITSALTIQVSQTLKGTHQGIERRFTLPGGIVGREASGVSYLPMLTTGDKVLLLLDAQGAILPGQTVFKVNKGTNVLEGTNLTISDVQGLL